MANLTIPIQINLPEDWVEQIVNRLKNDPESEWVQIVRCKDCRYYRRMIDQDDLCKYRQMQVFDDDFCSRAERRTDETN